MKTPTIVCKGIKKSYGSNGNITEALKGIDLEIFNNELTILQGPSGSGKTTLLSIISTLLKPDSGELSLLNQNMSQMSEANRAKFCRDNLGIVFQSLFLIPTLTVLENVTLPLIIEGEHEIPASRRAMEILERMHLAHKANVSSDHLSKGQQQRVAIARGLIGDPKIIICDEPTSSLDHVVGFEIMSFLHELATHSEKTVLVVTHDTSILRFGDRTIKLIDGQITQGIET